MTTRDPSADDVSAGLRVARNFENADNSSTVRVEASLLKLSANWSYMQVDEAVAEQVHVRLSSTARRTTLFVVNQDDATLPPSRYVTWMISPGDLVIHRDDLHAYVVDIATQRRGAPGPEPERPTLYRALHYISPSELNSDLGLLNSAILLAVPHVRIGRGELGRGSSSGRRTLVPSAAFLTQLIPVEVVLRA